MCCEPISFLYFLCALSCEQKICEPISLLYFLRALSFEQKLCEPISLSLSLLLTGSQVPCSARNAVATLHHFMLPCCYNRGTFKKTGSFKDFDADDENEMIIWHLQTFLFVFWLALIGCWGGVQIINLAFTNCGDEAPLQTPQQATVQICAVDIFSTRSSNKEEKYLSAEENHEKALMTRDDPPLEGNEDKM